MVILSQESNPLVGTWRDREKESRELVFKADGGYSVTRRPFEEYRDYWGNCTFDTSGLPKRALVQKLMAGEHIGKTAAYQRVEKAVDKGALKEDPSTKMLSLPASTAVEG
jgi:hypothetical protein